MTSSFWSSDSAANDLPPNLLAAGDLERGQRLAILLRRGVGRLRPLLLGAFLERPHHVEGLVPPVRPGKLPVDEDCAAAIFAAGRLRIGRNQAIDKGFDGCRLLRREKVPTVRGDNRRRIGGSGRPRHPAFDHGRPRAWRHQKQRYRA